MTCTKVLYEQVGALTDHCLEVERERERDAILGGEMHAFDLDWRWKVHEGEKALIR